MSTHDFEVHQEEDVVASRSLVRIGVVSVLVGAIGVLIAGLLLAIRVGGVKPSLAGPSGPRVAPREISQAEQTPIWDTRVAGDLRDAQRRELAGWGWGDRDAGIARIPIDRAMDLVVKESR
jgi:hypothetical protein